MEGVPPASHRVLRAPWYSGSLPPAARFRLQDSHPLWWAVPGSFDYPADISVSGRQTTLEILQPLYDIGLPSTQSYRFGLSPVRSPLLGASRLISLPRGTEMFQFPRFPHVAYGFSYASSPMTVMGFAHSGIPGSACWTAPRGFSQSCHALLRLRAPRHPP